MSDRIGQQLGNYQLLRLLGEGGFAQVYLGEHIHLGTEAAIKVLHTQLTSDDVDHFRSEARTIARLKHLHIVRVLDFGVEGKTPFLVMDYAPNGTLRQHYPRGSRLPLPTLVSYIKQVATALQYAHDQKLIHRDIKPENMLLETNNEVLLSDFGIALIAQSSRQQSTQDVVGTVAYMSPEQIQGKPRPASDQYSLAIVAYEWLTGMLPFHGSFTEMCTQHMFALPPPLREKIPDISPDIEQVIMTALSKDSHQRFANVEAFATALEQATQGDLPTYVKPLSGPRPFLKGSPTVKSSSPSLPPTVKSLSSSLPPTIPVPPPIMVSSTCGTLISKYEGHTDQVSAIAWSVDGQRIASSSHDKIIQIWDAQTGKLISTFDIPSSQIHTIAWSPDGKHIAFSYSNIAEVWDTIHMERTCIYRGHSKNIRILRWFSNGRDIATGSDDSSVHIWDTTNGKRTLTQWGSAAKMLPVAISPDVKHIAWAGDGYDIEVWKLEESEQECTYTGHADQILAVEWSPNGTWIVSLDKETVQVWNAVTGKKISLYRRRFITNRTITAWSPDTMRIAFDDFKDNGETVNILNAANGSEFYAYRGHTNEVQALAWSPDGTYIASASRDAKGRGYSIHVWKAI